MWSRLMILALLLIDTDPKRTDQVVKCLGFVVFNKI